MAFSPAKYIEASNRLGRQCRRGYHVHAAFLRDTLPFPTPQSFAGYDEAEARRVATWAANYQQRPVVLIGPDGSVVCEVSPC